MEDEIEESSMERRYEKLDFLGEGQFATVYKARDTQNDVIVAVKKIKIGSRAEAMDGINRTALREIKLLQELKHTNIIGLLDVFGHKSNVSLVFDFMETDLENVIKDSQMVLTPANIKAYTLMTLKGLEYLHAHWILHRDMKPNNLLLDSNGILKIGDFGLARSFGTPSRQYTHQVVTRWYRAPELLFGATLYGTGVDLWAVGCILAELLLRIPFLPGDSDLDQLDKIFQALGTPENDDWPNMIMLPAYIRFTKYERPPLRHIFSAASNDLLELLARLLSIDPSKRDDSIQALSREYFRCKPFPTPCHLLPSSVKKVKVEEKISSRMKRKSTVDHLDGSHAKRLVF